MSKPYLKHLKSAVDLRTTYEAKRAGFVSLALEKNEQATPLIEQARTLQAAASRAKKPKDLLSLKEIRKGLLVAAGVSDKAENYLHDDDKIKAISGLIEKFLEPAGEKFVEELVFRFLLTRGDSLGGAMRNIAGKLAERRFTRSMLSCLSLAGIAYKLRLRPSGEWIEPHEDEAGIEKFVGALSWDSNRGPRVLLYNRTVKLVGKNIDLVLLQAAPAVSDNSGLSDPALFVALGELKGGIDPAGADEHWKTARSALDRIHKAFTGLSVCTFFIGAAIEESMSDEIWAWLENDIINNAANLTNDQQLEAISNWIIAL
ncbi:MAG: type II restriction endonuclease [Bryobacteraceae bacterium]|nr:restriction endonuclease [Solibacteraceae bacterium]MCO5350410.1 type II restriction endonuclease [Bryobacteraceae bacterium]